MKHRTKHNLMALLTGLVLAQSAGAQTPTGAPNIVLDKAAQVTSVPAATAGSAAQKWSGPQDLSARAWLRRAGTGRNRALLLTIDVRDDIFDQPFAPPEAWRGDGVQAAFAVPGQNGHWEIGLSRGQNGAGAAHLFVSPAGQPDPLRDVRVTVALLKGGARYTARLPFRSFGLSDAALQRGIRFNLLVNDSDGGGVRETYITLAPGIGDEKSAKAFYTLTFTPNTMQPTLSPPPPPRPDYRLAGPLSTRTVAGPQWAKNAPIYQAYPHDSWSKEYQAGSYFRRTEALLPALKEMGVGIIYMVPIHPRGGDKTNPPPNISPEAGIESGSPYSVRDYYAIDPQWGTPAELKQMIARAHKLGLRVIMDWVPNHTSWGNALLREHPDFYKRDANGLAQTVGGWKDIAQLDFSNRAVWDYQRDALLHYLHQYDVDGFRMDVAGRIPIEFWKWLRPQLDAVKPVFVLAEADEPRHHPTLDATYGWSLQRVMWGLARRGVRAQDNQFDAREIDALVRREAAEYPAGAVRMWHLDNHDLHFNPNPWTSGIGAAQNNVEGGVLARYGEGYRAFCVLAATLPGKPLVYNGQELFEPGGGAPPVPSTTEILRGAPQFGFFKTLLNLYRDNPALYQGAFRKLPSSNDAQIHAFERSRGARRVVVVLNLSSQAQNARLRGVQAGRYRAVLSDQTAGALQTLSATPAIALKPWAYRVFESAR